MQDKRLLERAKAMRHEATRFEVRLWRSLSNSQLGGFKFRRQHVIDDAIVDFFCPAKGVIVEIDGDTHDMARDARRDADMAALGFETVRFTNVEVGENLEGCLERLLTVLQGRPNRWSGLPHPNPSPGGEGLSRGSPGGEGLSRGFPEGEELRRGFPEGEELRRGFPEGEGL